MNLVECIKSLLSEGPYMDEFNGIHVDYSTNDNKDCGLFLTNDSKLGEDLLGNVKRSATFTIYRNVYNASDSERLQNSTFILSLSSYLESLSEYIIEFDYQIGKDTTKKANITEIRCSNGMMFQYLNGTPGRGAQYMLQVSVNYVVKTYDY